MPKYKIRNNFTKKERRMKFEYHEFIKSHLWEMQKIDWYSRHKKRCAMCKSERYINLHHKIYPKNKRFLSLQDRAFIALCRTCHFEYHKKHGVKRNMCRSTNSFFKSKRAKLE